MKTMLFANALKLTNGCCARGKTAVVLAGFALATVVLGGTSLFAEILDDFNPPLQDWTTVVSLGTGGAVADGQLRLTAKPAGNEGAFSIVHYKPRTFRLEAGRTLEFRVDLISCSGDGAVAWIQFGLSDGLYALGVDPDTIVFAKNPAPRKIFLLTNNTPIKTHNVKLVMAMTGGRSDVTIRTKVLDNENGGAVLFDRVFRDTAGQDPLQLGVDQPPASFLGRSGTFDLLLYHDSGGFFDPNVTVRPTEQAEVVFDNAEVLEYETPLLDIQNAVLLSWPEPTEEQIVVGADSVSGSWAPWPEPIFKRHGQLCMAAPTAAAQQYFMLVRGTQFIDDFSGGKQPWVASFSDEANASKWVVTNENNALRIQMRTAPKDPRIFLYPPGPDVVVGDFWASVDILNWDPNALDQYFGIVGRVASDGYVAFIRLSADMKGKGVVNFYKGQGQYANDTSFDLKSGTKYRLCFSAVGSQLSLRLYELGNLRQPVAQIPITDSKYSQGKVGLHGNTSFSSYAFTVDNFFVTGTKP